MCIATATKANLADKQREDDEEPTLLKPLLSAYRCLPVIALPGTHDFSISFTFASSFVLAIIRTIFWKLLLSVGWPLRSKMTTDAAASLASIVHAFVLCFYLTIALTSTKYIPSARLTSSPKWFQDAATALLEMCTGYVECMLSTT